MNAITTTNTQTLDLVHVGEIFAASGMFPTARDAAQCATKLIVGQSIGLNAYDSMSGLQLIDGKISLAANLMAAAIKRSGKYDYRAATTADACSITFYDVSSGDPVRIGDRTFTMEDAHRAGLLSGKAWDRGVSVWQKYPEAMLFARCISAGYREHCPDAIGGGGPVYVEAHGESEIGGPPPSEPTRNGVLDPPRSIPSFDMQSNRVPQDSVASAPAAPQIPSQAAVVQTAPNTPETHGEHTAALTPADEAAALFDPSRPFRRGPVAQTPAEVAAVRQPAAQAPPPNGHTATIQPSFIDQYNRQDRDRTPYWRVKTRDNAVYMVWDSELADVLTARTGQQVSVEFKPAAKDGQNPSITAVIS